MNRKTFKSVTLSSLLVATTMVVCTGAAFRPSAAVVQPQRDAAKSAVAAEKALTDRNGAKAVEAAEAAVRLDPQNATYRRTLGRAYVLAGRFASAESALSDAVSLGDGDASTFVNLALVQTAQGRAEVARELLTAHADIIPAGDYGLAMAIAGDPAEGARILSAAIQDPSATVRTRQNLAYAYALAGRWKDARMVVGMDMEPLAANKRISDWAQIAEPSLAPLRVAALMGVTINQADPGQPVALALAAPASPVEMASAASEPSIPNLPMQMADENGAPQPVPVIQALPEPVRVAAYGSENRLKMRAAGSRMPVANMERAAFIRPVGTGASQWVVQLGAYDNAAVAKEKWFAMAGRNTSLAAFPVLTSQATVNGRGYHRLAISGFGDRNAAATMCRTIRSRGGQCFVRETAPDATPQRWALSGRGRQFASR
jgi:Flp pilus assembly protein TadD